MKTGNDHDASGWSRRRRSRNAWTGILEFDAALRIYREAEDSYGEKCDLIMGIEGGPYVSPERGRLSELESEASTWRTALGEASRVLDQVCGPTVGKLLRMDRVAEAIGAIRSLVCRSCGARACADPDGAVLLCRRCRRARETALDVDAPAAAADEVIVDVEAEVVERPALTITEEPALAVPIVSVDDAKLPVVIGGESPTGTGRKCVMAETAKSGLAKLREAHESYEKAYAELAKAHAAGDAEEAALVWVDLASAEIEVAKAKVAALGCLISSPKKAASPTKKTALPKAAPPKATAKKPKAVPSGAFAGWLRAARSGVGLSQVSFAQKIGASETQMWHWEKGSRTPDDAYVTKIEQLVGKASPKAFAS